MHQEIVNCFSKGLKVVLDNIPDVVCVNVKVSMCNMVAHAHYLSPWYFRAKGKLLLVYLDIYLLEAFSYSLDEHTTGSQCFRAFRRCQQVVDTAQRQTPLLQLFYRIAYLLQNIFNDQ